MAKSSYERLLQKKIRQDKSAEKAREKAARKEAIREQASSVVNGQPIVEGMRIMDATSEEVLRCLLRCELDDGNRLNFSYDIFPEYVHFSINLELEKLVQYGMIGGVLFTLNSGSLNLLPTALTYFEDKVVALERQKEAMEKISSGNTYNNYNGNMVFGNVIDSTLTVDNAIQKLEKDIDDLGGDDKEVLHELLDEVKELIENMESSRSIPKQKKLSQKLNDHVVKHGWFYGAVIQLLGTAVMNNLGA